MERRLLVSVDRTTWPQASSYPTYPASFNQFPEFWDVNIPAMLLTIGFLTTPSHSSGVSLSEFWAWVRYLHAVAPDQELRLTKAFFELDPHQKTILSDDFGMGAPMYWLARKLNLGQIADGRYFIDRVAATVGAVAAKPKKRGPGKSPDFVARDMNGIWHVVECKGTQTSGEYRASQIGTVGPPATGAVAQKQTIQFPRGYSGQRLATGLYLAVENSPYSSGLHIVDPPGDEEFEVEADQMVFADDAIARAVGARSLRLAGFPATSSIISAPMGVSPSSRPTTGKYEQNRREIVDEKQARANEELKNRGDRETFQSEGQPYRGRKVTISLPAPLWIGRRMSTAITVRYGVGRHFLEEIRSRPFENDPIQETIPAIRELQPGTRVDGDARGARLHVGKSFVADLVFNK
ncbi:MAG: hypothetical protein EOS22_04250 [Mesorhizobium sp.]|uniref:hypothetical protein n=1 Tax=Mesorhizobium sp. TaxID=1871066 RepID=UPI000FE8C92B|nr:hypothetical protein [Mesorhizobium sp.]RWD31640.1 MAG: hypothetical protein EOS22_04250 [Mesorhizobium sp.]TJW70714.1 MAG: hypothetical protein E5V29_03585 [Mesorhizobium sp.]